MRMASDVHVIQIGDGGRFEHFYSNAPNTDPPPNSGGGNREILNCCGGNSSTTSKTKRLSSHSCYHNNDPLESSSGGDSMGGFIAVCVCLFILVLFYFALSYPTNNYYRVHYPGHSPPMYSVPETPHSFYAW